MLGEHRLVTLAGAGGSGKTRLAAQTAVDVADSYPDGIWWIDLSPVADPAVVPWVVLAALGLGDDRGLDPVERIAGHLAGGRVLLLVDNCEHVLGPTATAVDRLLRACPAIAVLATTAARDRHAAHFLARAEAAAALLSRELRPHLLAALELDHENLRAALEWSTTSSADSNDSNDSNGTALRLVVALALFWHVHGHFAEGLAWHRRVLARVPQDASAMRCRAISGLGYLSLNCMELGNGLGLGELTEAVELARALNEPGLAARPFAALGATQAFGHPGDPAATLGEAVAAARGSGDGWDLWCALWWQGFYRVYTLNRPAEAGPVLAELDAISRRSENDSCRGWDDIIRLLAAWQNGRAADARATMDAVLHRAYRSNDPLLESHAVLFGADALIALGEYAEAEALGVRTALRLHRSIDACRQGFVEFGLARLALARGDLQEATRQADALADLLHRTGLPLVIQWLGLLRGRVALERGEFAAARSAIADAAVSAEAIGIPWDVADVRHHQGLLALAEKDHRAAAVRLHEALDIDIEHGFRGRAIDTLEVLAALAAAADRAPVSARLLVAADALRAATGVLRKPIDDPMYDATELRVQGVLGVPEFARLRAEGARMGLREAAGYSVRSTSSD